MKYILHVFFYEYVWFFGLFIEARFCDLYIRLNTLTGILYVQSFPSNQ